jgi:hypothetical protein
MSSKKDRILATVPFRFKDVDKCRAIAVMSPSFNFNSEMLGFMEFSLGIKAFDLFCIPAFTNRLLEESETVIKTFSLARDKHEIERVTFLQHPHCYPPGKASQFSAPVEEDAYHKAGLIKSAKNIRARYPEVETDLIYARIVNNQTEIEFVEVFDCGRERVRLITPYRFKDIYHCDCAIILCLDFRFRKESRICVRDSLKFSNFDIIGLKGSIQGFLEEGRMVPWEAIDAAYYERGCRKFPVIHHQDCGAYGGSKYFVNSTVEENFHREQINLFEIKFKERYPDAEIIKIYARLIENETKIQFVLVK